MDNNEVKTDNWDHSSRQEFFEDYAEKSLSEATYQRFLRFYQITTDLLGAERKNTPADVVDIGCGAGTQCRIWAEKGHRVVGLDVNEPLIELARERAKSEGLKLNFEVGSATNLPWEDNSFDVCLSPELLEHVEDWESCVNEFCRVLRPGGILLMTTTNKLCPKQEEFNLPLYSWYPRFIKRFCEKKAVTTHPQIANYAKYPAVHWFSFYGLQEYLAAKGFKSFDRFDVIDLSDKSSLAVLVVNTIKKFKAIRLMAHIATSYTFIVSVKQPAQ